MSANRRSGSYVMLCTLTSIFCIPLFACEGVIAEQDGPAGPRGDDPAARDGEETEGDPGSTGGVSAFVCEERHADRTPLRLLSREEYNRTVADLFGDDSAPLEMDPASADVGYDNDALGLSISPEMLQHYQEVAEQVAQRAVAGGLETLLPCDPAVDGEAECAAQAVRQLGSRVYRRPLEAEQAAALDEVYAMGAAGGGFAAGMQSAIEAMLLSPWFLYHVELGETPDDSGRVPLGDWEVASRLSYFLWNSLPDEELRAAAERGELSTAEQVEAQARRMMDDPRASRGIRHFHRQWLELDELEGATKDPELFPAFDAQLREDLQEETLAFVEEVVRTGGDVMSLFIAPYTMMNARVADFYGVSGPSGEDFERVELGPTRAGLLTHASLMAANAKSARTSPIHRGLLVRTRFLCQPLPPPPPDIPSLPEANPSLNERERLAQHREDPSCSGCHQLMDPIGFAFEHYDADGSYREMDVDGSPIDASGEIRASRDADGIVDGAFELSALLADSEGVRECVARQWFRYAMGRNEDERDGCTMGDIMNDFEAGEYRIRELIVAIAKSEAFRFRDPATVGGECR